MQTSSNTLSHATERLLKPLVRLLLRNGIAFDAVNELLKKLYVEVANEEFALPGKKQSVSRISTLTGLNRKEVARAKAMEKLDLGEMSQQYNRAAKVISGWVRDDRFHTGKGQPCPLSLDKGQNSFKDLVKIYSGDIPTIAIADELLRVGAVEYTTDGRLRLLKRAYVPLKNVDEKIRILGSDVSDLINTIDHNIFIEPSAPYFQRKVAYDAIVDNHLDDLQEQIGTRAQTCLEDLDHLLRQHDSNANPSLKNTGTRRVGIGIYYFMDDKDND